MSSSSPTFLFIDGSYYCFYRYYSMMTWWRHAFPEIPLENPYENEEFLNKFKKTFIEKLKQIPKMLNIGNETPTIIVGKDCKRDNIWRNKLFPAYKANRDNPINKFMGGPFFRMVYEDNMFKMGGAHHIIKHPELEADDCIALSVKHLLNKYPSCNIYIITSDKDYLQLVRDNVKIFNLSFKNIAENKTSTGNYQNDLDIKIIMGDISDNIPSVFPKCGPKTAKKCIENPEFFKTKLKSEEHVKQYELNKILVNFDNIPNKLAEEFIQTVQY
jgi:DNA polymerase-1